MEEVIFLFLYHKLDEVTRRHFELLRAFNPRDLIVPVAYQLSISERLPGTVDVALDWDYGWPIFNTWPEIDKIYLRWFLAPGQPRARRYVFFEYDIRVGASAQNFFGNAWNADAAAVAIKTPDSDPHWAWWAHGPLLLEPPSVWQGLTPLAGQLWSHEALEHVAQQRCFQRCFCELRLGTIARKLGLQCRDIPHAGRTFSWREEDIQLDDAQTWHHPVKSVVRNSKDATSFEGSTLGRGQS